jgi:hypothetical protein
MQIKDQFINTVGLGSDTSRDTIGIVFKTSEELNNRPLLGLIIPKFMIGYDFKNSNKAEDKTLKISSSKIINDSSCSGFWNNEIIYKNYILVRPFLNQNQSMPNYTIGDKVIVTMIDNDIKTLAFLPYSINRLGQRATDKLFMSVPANEQENTTLDEDNTYFLKIDSKEKVLILHTSDKNGEAAQYTIGIDTDNGQVIISDCDERSWTLDSKNDSVVTKTSGSEISQVGDQVTIKGDVISLEADSKVSIKSDTLEIDMNSIKAESSDTKFEFDNFSLKSDIGKFEIDNESHEGMSMKVKESTYHNDTSIIGLNGQVIFPNYVIGNVPNINAPVPPLNGTSGPSGSMVLQTDPSGVPLVKFPQLAAALTAIAAAADAYPSGAGAATAAASAFLSGGMTTKILSS